MEGRDWRVRGEDKGEGRDGRVRAGDRMEGRDERLRSGDRREGRDGKGCGWKMEVGREKNEGVGGVVK